MRRLLAAIAVVAMACGGAETNGGEAENSAAPEAPEASAQAAPEAQGTGTVHTVDMVLNEAGEYRYVPEELTIKVGDTVQWINVSGGPHNVQFFGDRIPGGAEEVLNSAMANRMGNLTGPLLTAPNAVYEMTFVDAPVGDYAYTCTPHELLGMNGSLTIEQ